MVISEHIHPLEHITVLGLVLKLISKENVKLHLSCTVMVLEWYLFNFSTQFPISIEDSGKNGQLSRKRYINQFMTKINVTVGIKTK